MPRKVKQRRPVLVHILTHTGLGLAIATYIVKNGHNAVLVARRKDLLDKLQSEYPKQIRYVAGDLARSGLGKQAVDLATSQFGGLDGLVVNQGVLLEMKPIATASVEEWKKSYDINVFSAIEFVQAAIPALRKSNGSIIFSSSGASKKSNMAWGAYGSAKAVLDHVAATLASEEPDITSIAIAPGTVDTDMQREIREVHHSNFEPEYAERFLNLGKEGKLLRPAQPGSLMARLALDPPKELSGKYLRWDVEELAAFRKTDD